MNESNCGFGPPMCDISIRPFGFAVSLGGDGTILFASGPPQPTIPDAMNRRGLT